MKLRYLLPVFSLLTSILSQPVIYTQSVDPVTGLILVVAGALVGGGVVDLHHTSKKAKQRELELKKERQDQNAEQEHKIVSAVTFSLERIRKNGHELLHERPSYNLLQQIRTEHEWQEIIDQLGSYLPEVQQSITNLGIVTGKHGEASKEHYQKAKELHNELVSLKSNLMTWQQLFATFTANRQRPIRVKEEIKPFMDEIEANKHNVQRLLNFIKEKYASKVTNDGIRNVPLVCALETISDKLALIGHCRESLYTHKQIVEEQDGIAEAALNQFDRWDKALAEVGRLIASSDLYKEQAKMHQIFKEALLNAKAEADRERAKRDREETARLDAEIKLKREEQLRLQDATRLQESRNREKEIQARQAEAIAMQARIAMQALDDTRDKKINRLKNKVAALRQEKDELASQLSLVKNDNKGHLAQINALQHRINSLEKQIKSLKDEAGQREAEPGATEGEQREGYCAYHKCLMDRCPDLTCREGA